MKTTLNIDDRLMRKAKRVAADRGVTLTSLIEEVLRLALIERPARSAGPLELTTVKGRRPPSVDIADRDALYDRMESRS